MMARLYKRFLRQRGGRAATIKHQVHASISTLTVDLFKRCIAGELQALVSSGNPNNTLLHDTWAAIYAEYFDKISDGKPTEALRLQSDITVITAKLVEIEACIRGLAHCHSDHMVAHLKGLGFDYTFSEATLAEDLRRVIAEMKTIEVQLQQKQAELDRLHGAAKPTNATDIVDANMAAIAKHIGFIPKNSDVTVLQYCIWLSEIRAHIEHLNRQIRNQHGG